MTTEIQRIAQRHGSAQDLLAELRIRAETTSIHRPDPSIVSKEREPAYNHLARLTKPFLGMKFIGIKWLVIGDSALVNFGSSHLPKEIEALVNLNSKQSLEEYFHDSGITKHDGGDHHGFKYTKWDGIKTYFYHLPNFPDAEKDTTCITTKGWPLCNHSAAIAWSLLSYTKQDLANIVDILVGGLPVDWELVKYWLSEFCSDRDCGDLEKIGDSITEDEEVWGKLVI